MPQATNRFGQPVGAPIPGWMARPAPPASAMEGRLGTVEPLDPARHGAALATAMAADRDGRTWTYLPLEQPPDPAAYRAWLGTIAGKPDPIYHAIVDRRDGMAAGIAEAARVLR